MLYGFRSVVVITCASHAQGPRFEPGRKHRFEEMCEKKKHKTTLAGLEPAIP